MTELNKLFVLVPQSAVSTAAQLETLVSTSNVEANQKKIYFVQAFNQIVNRGVVYGIDPNTTNSIEDLIKLVGQNGKLATTDVPGAKSVIERLQNLEAIHVATGSENYLKVTGQATDSSILTNPSIGVNVVGIESGQQGLVDAVNAKAYIDASILKATSKVAVGTGLKLDVTQNADNSSTYTVSPDFTLVYHAAEGDVSSHIAIEKDSSVFGSIPVSAIIGNGVLTDTSYNSTTGVLTLNFNTADGIGKAEQVNLGQLLDLNDIIIKSGSEDYLEVSLPTNAGDTAQLELAVKLQDVSTAAANATGLADAWSVKQYVDSQTTDLAVDAEGDNYVTASVDPATDKKKVNVSTNVGAVTASAGTRSSYTVSDAGAITKTDGTVPELSGVANTLVDGAAALAGVKTYVDAVVAEEALRANAQVEGAIKALDSEQSGTGVNVSVNASIVDGKLVQVNVEEKYAEITRTAHSDNPATSAAYTVKTGDESKLVKASDLANLKLYTDDKIAESTADLHVTVTGDNYINAAANDKHIDVSADVQTLTVTKGTAGAYDNVTGAESTAPSHGALSGVANSLVDGSDVATKVKDYVDGEVAIETARTDAAIKQAITALDSSLHSAGSVNVAGDVSIEDGKLVKFNITETYASVTGTRSASGTPAAIVITTSTGLVTGNDISTLKDYVDDKVSESSADLSVSGESKKPDYITLDQSTNSNKTLVVDVTLDELVFTEGTAGGDSTLAGNTGLATGADVATKVTSFVNARITEEINKLDSSVEDADAKGYISVETVQANGELSSQTVETTYGTYGASATADASGVATVEATRAFVDTYDYWETYSAS